MINLLTEPIPLKSIIYNFFITYSYEVLNNLISDFFKSGDLENVEFFCKVIALKHLKENKK